MTLSHCVSICLLMLAGATATKAFSADSPAAPAAGKDPALALFDEGVELARKNCEIRYGMNGELGRQTAPRLAEIRKALSPQTSPEQASGALGDALAILTAGHAYYATPATQAYYATRGAFFPEDPRAQETMPHIGAWFERRGKHWHVRRVLPQSPAASAGLMRGDEVLTANGQAFDPIAAFASLKAGEKVQLAVRSKPWDQPRKLDIARDPRSWRDALVQASAASVEVFKAGERKIGRMWLPAANDVRLQQTLRASLLRLNEQADAVVLDLRDHLGGGADAVYAEEILGSEAFASKSAAEATQSEGKAGLRKPMIVLVDDGTRGGRELLAGLLQSSGYARLFGSPTPGYILPGQAHALASGPGLIYVPHCARASKGLLAREGQSLKLDTRVDAPLPYAQGEDPAMAAALRELSKPRR